jgi:hypothetical protein
VIKEIASLLKLGSVLIALRKIQEKINFANIVGVGKIKMHLLIFIIILGMSAFSVSEEFSKEECANSLLPVPVDEKDWVCRICGAENPNYTWFCKDCKTKKRIDQ